MCVLEDIENSYLKFTEIYESLLNTEGEITESDEAVFLAHLQNWAAISRTVDFFNDISNNLKLMSQILNGSEDYLTSPASGRKLTKQLVTSKVSRFLKIFQKFNNS